MSNCIMVNHTGDTFFECDMNFSPKNVPITLQSSHHQDFFLTWMQPKYS